MKKKFIPLLLVIFLIVPVPRMAKADLFGADAAILAKILANAIQQLAQMREILRTGNDTLGLLRDINRGINDSLRMAETLGLRIDPGLYRELRDIGAALNSVEGLFGKAVDSRNAVVQRNTDQTVAEAITFNNELNDYTRRLDIIGEEIKAYSHSVSPGGASKLTAQSLGVLIHVMNQQIRATGQGLKLQAQALALQNKQEKDKTAQYLKEGERLKNKLQSLDSKFQAPRF